MSGAMKHNLRYYIGYYSAYLCAFIIGFIFYTLVINSSTALNGMIYRSMCLSLLTFGSFAFAWAHNMTALPLGIGFGSTRKAWVTASILSRIISAIICNMFAALVAMPLAQLIFGEPVTCDLSTLPFWTTLTLSLTSLGALLGLCILRFGMKRVLLITVAAITIDAVTIAYFLLTKDFPLNLPGILISNPLTAVVLIGLSAALELLNSRLLHKIEVRG